MKVAVIGYSQSGRTTLYQAAARGQAKGEVTAVPVPDPRFDRIVAQVQPKKVVPATVVFQDDLEPIAGTGRAFSPKFLEQVRKAEVILHVVRAFESNMSPYHAEVDPARDAEAIEMEMILTDLQMVETRLEKLKKSQTVKQPGSPDYQEQALFTRIQPLLEEGSALRGLEFDEEEQKIIRNYQMLSAKPCVVAFNVGDDAAAAASAPIQKLIDASTAKGIPAFSVCATVEKEISELDEADQPEFLADMGLTEPASHRMIRAVYEACGLITFFTAGENITQAWPLRKGSSALKAAATIHNEIAKGFIRAEVVHYADYDAAGSLDAAYKGNKMVLQGKEYVIEDGDLLNIRNKS